MSGRTKHTEEDIALKTHPSEFSHFLLIAILQTTLVGAFFGIAGGILFGVGQVLSTQTFHKEGIAGYVFVAAQMASVLAVIIVTRIAQRTLRIAKSVRGFA